MVKKKPVLHVIDTHTLYQNAEFIYDKSANRLWESSLRIWVTIFIGFPNTLSLTNEASFGSEVFRQDRADVGMKLQFSGIESHNSIGVGGNTTTLYAESSRRLKKTTREWIKKR